MIFTDFLEFTLLKLGNYSLSVYQLLSVLLILFLARIIYQVLKKVMRRTLSRKKSIEEGRLYAFEQFLKYLVTIFALLVSLQSVGVNLSLVLAGSAALMVGIGLGLQHVFNDIVSGIILLTEGNISVGDDVEIGDKVGKIIRINVRTTHVVKRDGTVIVLPNSKLTTDGVTNWNQLGTVVRFSVKVGVDYSSDIDQVTNILLGVAKEHPKVSTSVSPFVRLNNFGDSSLDFELYFFTKETTPVDNTLSDLRYAIFRKFKQEKVVIPFPQRDLWIKGNG